MKNGSYYTLVASAFDKLLSAQNFEKNGMQGIYIYISMKVYVTSYPLDDCMQHSPQSIACGLPCKLAVA